MFVVTEKTEAHWRTRTWATAFATIGEATTAVAEHHAALWGAPGHEGMTNPDMATAVEDGVLLLSADWCEGLWQIAEVTPA